MNHAISFTDRGIFSVLPFLPSVDFTDLTFLLPSFSETVFCATFLLLATALDAADFVFLAAVLAVLLTFLAALFAAALTVFPLFTVFYNFSDIFRLKPAFIKPFLPAFLIPAADFIPASDNFFAVALPIPGRLIRAASGSFFDLEAMRSLGYPLWPSIMNPSLILGYFEERGLLATRYGDRT